MNLAIEIIIILGLFFILKSLVFKLACKFKTINKKAFFIHVGSFAAICGLVLMYHYDYSVFMKALAVTFQTAFCGLVTGLAVLILMHVGAWVKMILKYEFGCGCKSSTGNSTNSGSGKSKNS